MAALGIAVVTMSMYAWLINSVFLGVIIVVIAVPMLYWLQRKGLPNWLAFLITLLVLVIIGVAFALFFVESISRLVQAVPTYVEEAESLKATVESNFARLGFDTTGIRVILNFFDPGRILALIAELLAELTEAISNLVVVVLVVAFLLAEAMGLSKSNKLSQLGGARLARASKYIDDLRSYVVITSRLGVFTGVTVTIFLLILGVDFPVLWGVLAFFLNFIPTVGIWIAMIPPLILALLEFGLAKALLVVAGYLLIDAFVENVAKPKLLGEGLNMAPVVIILSLIFWAAVLGPFGALLAVPLTMAVKELVLEADEDNRWMAELMSSGEEDAENPVDAAPDDAQEDGTS